MASTLWAWLMRSNSSGGDAPSSEAYSTHTTRSPGSLTRSITKSWVPS
jgi:hypothetical protein